MTSTVMRHLVVPPSKIRQATSACCQILWRDIWVTLKDWRSFVVVTFVHPVLTLFVFGWLLPRLGQLPRSYTFLFIPGMIAMVTLLTAMQSVSIPLTMDFGYTREIEDRLLAPVPAAWVGMAKLVFGAVRGLAAGLLLGALAYWLVMEGQWMGVFRPLLLFVVATMTAFCGAAAGLTLGTLVKPGNFSEVFSVAITPLGFVGCVYYPWGMLQGIHWLQVLTCFNPLTYASEGFRATITPTMPHMSLSVILTGQTISLLCLLYVGLVAFLKKAVE